MKPLSTLVLSFALVLALGGCQPATSGPASPSSQPAASSTLPATSGAAQQGPDTPPAVAGPDQQPPAVTPDKVPAELKTDAYRYYGVENSAPMNMEISQVGGSALTGTSVNRIKEVKDGKAILSVERSGGLAALGSEEDSIEKDGIHTLSTTMGKMKNAGALELPAKLAPGTAWKVSHEMTRDDGTKVSEDMEYTVVGNRKVETKAGPYNDALLITMAGTTVVEGKKAHATGKVWYVANKGMVKMELTQGPASRTEKTRTIVIQETK